MPERRVDGIAKSEAVGWSSRGLSKAAPSPLRILSGQLSDIPIGKTMTAVVQNTKSGVFTITLNGETLTLKGLPPTLTGKQADFIAQQGKSGGRTMTQLFWTGISRSNQPAATPLALRSALPAALSPGSAISARIESVQAGVMQLRIEGGAKQTIATTAAAGFKTGQTLNGIVHEIDGKPVLLARASQPQLQVGSRQAEPGITPLVLRSALPAGVTAGSAISARIESLQSGLMQLRIEGGTAANHTITTTAAAGFKTGQLVNGIVHEVDGKPVLLARTSQPQRQAEPGITPLALRSAPPAGLSPGSTISARVESIQPGHMQLRIEGGIASNQNIITTTAAGIKPDQLLTGTLQEIDGKPVFLTHSASSVEGRELLQQKSALPTQPTAPVNHALANMRPGATALAIVEKVLGNGQVQLSLQGNRINTPAPPSIAAGDGLIIKMTDKAPSFDVLSVQQNVIGKAHALVRQQAATNIPLADNLTAIRNLLAPLPVEAMRTIPVLAQLEGWLNSATVDPESPLNGERLAGMIQQSGQLLEHKLLQQGPLTASTLQDLKAILLAIASSPLTESSIRHLAQRLSELGHSAASRIESTQALNLLAQTHADPIRFELPMLVNQQVVNVQLSVEQQELADGEAGQMSNEQAGCKVLIALEMSRLGKLRVDATISDKAVHARIHALPEARDMMQSHIQRLESRLLNLGFSEIYLITTPAQPAQEMQQRFEQLEQMKPASPGLLDIRI